MTADDATRLFNPDPAITCVPLPGGSQVVVIDDVLRDPDALVDWARRQAFRPPPGFPYPGLVADGLADLSERFAAHFARHARTRLRARNARTTCDCRW
jgi:hypothetical protein